MPVDLDRDQLGIYFLDVGQGDCTVVVPPSDECAPILFDCADAFVARCFMAAHGIADLHAVVVSHLDIDHIRGMRPFLTKHFADQRRVERLYVALDGREAPQDRVEIVELLAQVRAWARRPPHAGFTVEPPFRTNAQVIPVARGREWRVELVLPFYDDTVALNPGPINPNALALLFDE
jgi:glyoxylase-like metal-dependent hydrolase (beta-lactamase superfamily II)